MRFIRFAVVNHDDHSPAIYGADGALPLLIVAADVSPLIFPAGEKFEPTHVGCHGMASGLRSLTAAGLRGSFPL
jgi:hypothetical protein